MKFIVVTLMIFALSKNGFAGKPNKRLIAYTVYACQTSDTAEGTEYKISVFPIDPEVPEQLARENAQAAQGLLSANSISNSIVVHLKTINPDDTDKDKTESVNKAICEKLGYDKNDPNYKEQSGLRFQKIEMSTTTNSGEIYLQSITIGNDTPLSY